MSGEATAVSRKLRKAGVNISPRYSRRKRDGVFVQGFPESGWPVTIYLDFDSMRYRAGHASQVITALVRLGYEYDIQDECRRIYVRKASNDKTG